MKPNLILGSLLLAGAASISSSTAAQQSTPAATPDSPDLVIRTNVRRVIEDVVVTDAQGNPAKTIDCSDFILKEDNKPQNILSCELHDGTKPEYIPPKLPPLPPNTYVDLPSAPEQGPLYVILYDMVNMELEDQGRTRKPLLEFIDSKPAGTRFAIFINTDKTRLLQGFTQDKNVLHAALTYQGPGPHIPRLFLDSANYGKGNTGAALSLFNQLASYLEGIPGRKNLIWIADAFPLNLFTTANLDDPNNSAFTEEEVKETVAALTRAQVALYPVDARGVSVWDSQSGARSTAGPSAVPITGGVSQTSADYVQEDALAQDTGGRAFYSSNHVGELLASAVEAGATYYTLTYAPPPHPERGRQHNIKIATEKAGLHLAYRQFYYDETADEDLQTAQKAPPRPGTLDFYRAQAKLHDTLYASVLHGAPMQHDLVFSTHVHLDGKPKLATPQQMAQIQDEPAFFRSRRRDKPRAPMPPIPLQKFKIDYRLIDPQLKRVAAQTGKQPTLEFAAAAYDADGRMVNGTLDRATADPPRAGQTNAAFFQVEQEIDLPLNAAWLRIAVRDTVTDRSGTLEIHLPLQPEPASKAGAF